VGCCVYGHEYSGSIKCAKFLAKLRIVRGYYEGTIRVLLASQQALCCAELVSWPHVLRRIEPKVRVTCTVCR
jgi:hypothetical protein